MSAKTTGICSCCMNALQVLTLQKTAAKTAKLAALAKRPEDARLEAAAAPAGALQAVVAPVQAPAAQPSEEPSFVKVFQQRKVEKSFQRSAEEALRRIAAAPASDVEVSSNALRCTRNHSFKTAMLTSPRLCTGYQQASVSPGVKSYASDPWHTLCITASPAL